MLNKAGVTPPLSATTLVVTDLDARLTTAGYGIRERMEVKLAAAEEGAATCGPAGSRRLLTNADGLTRGDRPCPVVHP